MKATERSIRGRQSRILGGYFESMVEASLEWYREKGLADVEKTPEAMKQLSRPNSRGQFLACYTKAAQPDFKGTLLGGRSVVFDAKHTDADRIEYKAVTKEQRERLEMHHNLGAKSFILVSFGLQEFYCIPWYLWRDMKAVYGHQYIRRDELHGTDYQVQTSGTLIKLFPEPKGE